MWQRVDVGALNTPTQSQEAGLATNFGFVNPKMMETVSINYSIFCKH